jgi:hypothetical protein
MSRRLHRRAAIATMAAALALGLAACPSKAPPPAPGELSYKDLPRLQLDVARVDIVDAAGRDASTGPSQGTRVDGTAPVTPAAAAARLASDRLVAVGSRGGATFTIVQSWIVEVPLPRTSGVQGMFTKDQAWRYDALVEVRLDVTGAPGLQAGTVTTSAQGSQSISEDVSLSERDRMLRNLIDGMTRRLSDELEKNMRQYLAGALR